MVEKRIESTPRWPVISVILGGVWLIALAVAATQGYFPHAMAAAPLGAVGLVRWYFRERPFRAELDDTGIRVDESEVITYSNMRTVTVDDLPTSRGQFPIRIDHDAGRLTIPASIDQPSRELLEFLRSQLPQSKADAYVNPALQDYLEEQLERFGHDKVICFSPRPDAAAPHQGVTTRRISQTILATGLIWSLAIPYSVIWIIPSIIMGVFGALLLLFSYSRRRSTIAHVLNWDESTIVVSPLGIAMVQGKLKGKLRWDEVLALNKPGQTHRSFQVSVSALMIRVAGSQIPIFDIYNRSLSEIYEVIRLYHDGD